MGKTICQAKKNGEVTRRGKASIEYYKDGKPQYFCYGYKDTMSDELLETCQKCIDNVIHCEDENIK